MVFEGYLKIGSTEIVNSERIRGFAASSDCHLSWLQGPECESLRDALGDEPYEMSNMPLAPWFDQSLPDLSGRFLGVYGLSISGLNSSTRSADSTEGIEDGGTLGRTRKSMMSARVRATLLAEGRDALDYGVSWLNAALDPDACGQHGSGCGTTDMEFLTDCPPERAEVDVYGEWTETRRNFDIDPMGAGAISLENAGYAPVVGTGAGYEATASSATLAAAVRTKNTQRPVAAQGEVWTVTVDLTNMADGDRELYAYIRFFDAAPGATQGNALLEVTSGNIVVGEGGTERFVVTAPAPVGTKSVAALFGRRPRGAAAGDVFLVSNSTLEKSSTAGPPFNGDTFDGELVRTQWVGAENASASILQTRESSTRLQTDEEYAVDVDEFRRFLHDVAVTSGPLVVEEHVFRRPKGYYGLTMEWTITSERAWIYSKTRPVELPVTPTVVMQDVAYNLATHPSAELAGDPVVAATNYSTNPSLETSGTGWFAYAEGPMDAPGVVASGRVVGELAAAGTASYRAVFTAAGAGSAGAMGVDHTVDISSRPSRSRVSISYWAAELLMSGTPVREPIEFQALWRSVNDGNVPPLRTDILGTASVDGGFVSAKSLEPPAGANFLTIRALARVTSWPAGTVLRLYADAAAVTVP